jgi:NhaP-type Na+/H+ or K+/H+ antiporter
MTNRLQVKPDEKTSNYLIGALIGAVVGLLASYLYGRAKDEERNEGNDVKPMQVGQMLAIGLALLGVVRQISEAGHPSAGKRSRR